MVSDRPLVRVENDDGIVTLTIDRPEKRNALNRAIHRQMHDALDQLRFDPDCRVLIVTGSGASFSAGQDFVEGLDAPTRALSNAWRNDLLRLFPAPTIAAVNGWCYGGAFSIVCVCDVAIAAEEAIFALSEINAGGVPGAMVAKNLVETLRPRETLYYALTGKSFDGRRAAEIGLVTAAVPKARLMPEVYELAQLLKTRDPLALRRAKAALKAEA